MTSSMKMKICRTSNKLRRWRPKKKKLINNLRKILKKEIKAKLKRNPK